MNILERFKLLVNSHDLTYDYSDDIRIYLKGEAEHRAIIELAYEIGEQEVVDIWNNMVKNSISEYSQKEYLWSSIPIKVSSKPQVINRNREEYKFYSVTEYCHNLIDNSNNILYSIASSYIGGDKVWETFINGYFLNFKTLELAKRFLVKKIELENGVVIL